MINGDFHNPINLGSSINSSRDDYAFIIDEEVNESYFSSNRDGLDQIYTGKRKENIRSKYVVVGVVQDSISKRVLPGSQVTLFDEHDVAIDDIVTGDDASYMFRVDPNKKYSVRATRKFYLSQNIAFSTQKDGRISHDIFLTLLSYQDSEERIQLDSKGDLQVKLEQVFFGFDQFVISLQAAAILEELVTIMNKYPDMHIEVSAHTDIRGSSEYNLLLSYKRAGSTMNYLMKQGINKNRLLSAGYGETQPLNNCIKEVVCTDKEYQINRRCEFKIIR
jgi:outer membrane protein OmpA-like peptidoglycan-associated protein